MNFQSTVQLLENEKSQIVSFGTDNFRGYIRTSSKLPADLADRIKKLSDESLAWFTGQLIDITAKYLPNVKKIVNESFENFTNFKHPIVGVHVRRTDKALKIKTNAIEDYMKQVNFYYDQLEFTQKVDKRRIYLATEDPDVIADVKKRYVKYEVISNIEASKIARNVTTRMSTVGLEGLIVDLFMLSQCDFTVCSFTSNICTLLLESYQIKHPNTANKLVSLKSIYNADYRKIWYGKMVHKFSRETRKDSFTLNRGEKIMIRKPLTRHGVYCGKVEKLKSNATCVPQYFVEMITESFFNTQSNISKT